MAHHYQEDGWPLGLDRLNVRIGLNRNGGGGGGGGDYYNGSVSFSTLLTPSISATDYSSDLDTQSTESFDRSINLGSLLRVSSLLQLSRRSTRVRQVESTRSKKNSGRTLTCLYLLCSRPSSDDHSVNSTPTLGFFLEEERRASTMHV